MNQYKKDDKAIKSDQAENAPKQEQKVEPLKLGSNVPSHIEKVASLHKKESLVNAEQSEQK